MLMREIPKLPIPVLKRAIVHDLKTFILHSNLEHDMSSVLIHTSLDDMRQLDMTMENFQIKPDELKPFLEHFTCQMTPDLFTIPSMDLQDFMYSEGEEYEKGLEKYSKLLCDLYDFMGSHTSVNTTFTPPVNMGMVQEEDNVEENEKGE